MGKSLNGKELGRGISQRKEDGLYVGRFVNRFGKREVLYARSYSEIRTKMNTAMYLDNSKSNVLNDKMTLNEWYEIWISTYKNRCRDSSLHTYEKWYSAIKSELGDIKLTSLNEYVIQRTFNSLKTDNMRRNCRCLLRGMLARAVSCELISKNPCEYVERGLSKRKARKEARYLSKEEEILLRGVLSKNQNLLDIFILGLNTGMRIGEMLGLTWDNVDLANRVVKVRNTLVSIKGGPVLHPPKSKSGVRDIPLSLEAYEMLSKRHDADPVGFVFKGRTGLPLDDADVRHMFKSYLKKTGDDLSDISLHSIRHTFATNCINKGMRPKTLQKILGHSTIQMTMDLYCHVPEEAIFEEMALVMDMAQ